ncbi:flagella basal body P-ring formation protein FlgA [Rhodomicrobium vannielii ATCC 17100]|uniref:Flagella basal body P-ring formation protein FlgA n=2 Tax=Rhodomicrobium vannielii TaxID=1069 RepID=E3I680_RHOVT|nr:flagella basal body P-ring formation protein FlgA [Rhodomicrobium vannielii ATCC 17100]
MGSIMKSVMITAAVAAPFFLATPSLAEEGGRIVPVPKRALYPGDVITEEMLTSKQLSENENASAFITEASGVVGKTSRRTLLPGLPIPKVAIREPVVVRQGKAVSLVYESDTVRITGLAMALQSGSVGETISARNPDSGVVIHGVVMADGSVRVN